MEKQNAEFVLEKMGKTIKLWNSKLDEYRNLVFRGQIEDGKEFNVENFDEEKGIIRFYTEKEIAGEKVNGIKIEDDEVRGEITELKEKLIREREKAREEYKEKLKNEEKLLEVNKVGTSHPHLKIYPSKEIVEKIGSSEAYDLINSLVDFRLMDYTPEVDEEGWYTLKEVAGNKIEENKKKRKEEKGKIKEAKEKAKKTGEEQIIEEYRAPCEDEREECNVDIVQRKVKPNGEIVTKRRHTW